MAQVYLESTDTTFTLSNAANVRGATGNQTVIINEGVTGVVFDQNVERVDLAGAFSDFKFQQAGNNLKVFNNAGVLVTTIKLQEDGTQVVASDGSVDAKLTVTTTSGVTTNVMTLGGATVSATATTVTPLPANVDTTITTGSEFTPVPTFSITGPTTAAESTSATYTVYLSQPQATAATVKLGTTYVGTASAADFDAMTAVGATLDATTGTLTFAAGVTSAAVTLPVKFDTTTETGESVTLTLSNPSKDTAVSSTPSVTTVLADPVQPTFTLTSNAVAGTPTQEGGTIVLTVTPASVVVTDTTMSVNLAGAAVGGVAKMADSTDFTPNSTTVTFKAGATTAQTVSVKVVSDDGPSEGLEGYKASLLEGTNFTEISSVTGTINDPFPSLTLAADKASVDEGSSVTYTVTSTIAASTAGLVVPYTLGGNATLGTDYTGGVATGGTIKIDAGKTTGTLILNATADTTTEAMAENVTVTLGATTGATVSTIPVPTTINDTSKAMGDAEIALSASASAVDEGGTVTYTVTRGANVPTGTTVTIPYTLTGTAENVTDYTRSESTGNLTIAAGSRTASVTVTTLADNTTEGTTPETVIMTLGTTLPAGTTVVTGQGGPITTTVNDTSTTVVGNTFTLTAGLDVVNGTSNNTVTGSTTFAGAGNDIFLGSNTLLTAGDSLDGLGGVNTLRVAAGAAINTTIATLANIQLVEISDGVAVAAGITHDLAGVPALTGFTLKNDNNAGNTTTIEGLKSTVGVTLDTQTDGTVALTYSDAASAGDQSATITYKGGTGDAGTNLTAAGIENVSLVANGSESKVGTLTFAAAKTVSIAADEAFTIADLTLNAATTTLTVSGDSKVTSTVSSTDGALTAINVSGTGSYVQSDALGGTAALVVTATGAATLDVLTGTATHKITGGDGADRIGIGATVLTTGTVNGGAGTADILSIADSTATLITTANKAQFSNFEILEVSGANKTFDFEALSGLTGLVIGTATSATINNVSATAAADVKVTGVQTAAATIAVKNATNPGTTDTLKLTLDHVTADTAVTVAALTIDGVETLQVHSTGTTTNVNSLDLNSASRLSTVTVTGDAKTTLTDAANLATEVSVNASRLTNTFNAVLDQNASGQTLIGATAFANTITGGAGIDIITGGSGNDTLSSRLGIGTINVGSGSDTVDITLTTAQAVADNRVTINGWEAATDSLDVNGTAFSALGAGDDDDITGGGIVTGEFSAITAAGNVVVANPVAVVELAWEFSSSVDLDSGAANSLNGTNLLSALGATTGATAGTITTAGNNEDLLIIAYQDGDALIYHGNGAGDNTGLVAAEISLIAEIQGVAVGSLTFADFI